MIFGSEFSATIFDKVLGNKGCCNNVGPKVAGIFSAIWRGKVYA
jgi:hypothetical protein